MAEAWRRVPAWRALGIPAGLLEASSEARVRTVDRTLSDGRDAGGVVLTPAPDKDRYPQVTVGRRKVRVATLVALAWHGPPEVRHMDDDRANARPENLAWGSHKENVRDRKRKAGKENRTFVSSPPSVASGPVSPVADG